MAYLLRSPDEERKLPFDLSNVPGALPLVPQGRRNCKFEDRQYVPAPVFAGRGKEERPGGARLHAGPLRRAAPSYAGAVRGADLYEKMFLEQGYKITFLRFRIDREGAYEYPQDPQEFDSKAWREAEGPRRTFGHQ